MKIIKSVIAIAFPFILIVLVSFTSSNTQPVIENDFQKSKLEVAYFASGCFWCVEAIFESVVGVEDAVSGYAGGFTKNPTYQSIGTGKTGHSETVAVYYNPKVVTFKTLVEVFFGSHNPTTKNGQHPDYGTQYRSIAFYTNNSEKLVIEKFVKALNDSYYKGKIVTEITALERFYVAEDYHQNYEKLNPNNPYVKNVSVPRLNRFKIKFPQLLKKEARLH